MTERAWWTNGVSESTSWPDLLQARLDVLELGLRPACSLADPDGGLARATGWRAPSELPVELQQALARIRASNPSTRQPRQPRERERRLSLVPDYEEEPE